MAENNDLLKCPLCQGQGELRRSDLLGCLTDRDLKAKIDRHLAEITKLGDEPSEPATVGANHGGRDFQKEVHQWNPDLPIWRRSQKE